MKIISPIFWASLSVSTIVIAVSLISHLIGIWPLYISREVRDQAEIVMLSLRNVQGIATSFFTVDSLSCNSETLSCRMLLKEQWNSVTAHTPLQKIHIVWQQNKPSEYSLTYDRLK